MAHDAMRRGEINHYINIAQLLRRERPTVGIFGGPSYLHLMSALARHFRH
jgi:hypothetical protein